MNTATKDRQQRKMEAERLRTVRRLFPDESLEVIIRELRDSGWVVANAIEALEALRDQRSPSSSHASHLQPPPAAGAGESRSRRNDGWVVLDSCPCPDEKGEEGAEVDLKAPQTPQSEEDAGQVGEELCVGGGSTTRKEEERREAETKEEEEKEEEGSREGRQQSEERQQRAEKQRQMMEEAERRWEEEKQRQAAAELLLARLKERKERHNSLTRPGCATTAAAAASSDRQRGTAGQEEEEEELEGQRNRGGGQQDLQPEQAVGLAGLVHELRRQLEERFSQRQIGGMRAIPCTITPEKAAHIFQEWRMSLWFAPTDFSQLVEPPSVTMTYVPYYCTSVRSVCEYGCRVEMTSPDGRKEERVVSGEREALHERNVCGAAHMRREVLALLSAVEPWDMEASLPLPASSAPAPSSPGEAPFVRVEPPLDPRDVWRMVGEAVVAAEKELCVKEALANVQRQHRNKRRRRRTGIALGDGEEEEGAGYGHQRETDREETVGEGAEEEEEEEGRVVRVLETNVARMEYRETRYRVVYVPLYVVRYTHGDPSNSGEFFFALNALNGKSHGQRPFGVGKILGRGLSFLEGLLGLKDHHTVEIVRGEQLNQIDRRLCYHDSDHYLIWPASHSYVVTHDTGYITLRNRSTHAVALSSQLRESKHSSARYVLQPGETQSFNYRGFWCLRLQLAEQHDNNAVDRSPTSVLSRAAAFLYSPLPSSHAGREVAWSQVLEVVAHSIDGGDHGNLLGMA